MSNGNTGLTYDLLNVGSLFSASRCFIVPKYQRGYSWTTEEIRELLEDLDEAWRQFDSEAYLLGQFIVCPSQKVNRINELPDEIDQLDLIDGQQRITTLYLFLTLAMQYMDKLELSGIVQMEEYQKQTLQLWRSRYRLVGVNNAIYTQVKPAQDGNIILDLQLDSKKLPKTSSSPTQENLLNGIDFINNWLEKIEPKDLYKFFQFVREKVFLVKIQLDTPAHALRVFQKVNNRGLQLDDADLIKSYLFQHVKSDADYARIAQTWDNATSILMTAKKKSLRMMETLMKLLIGIRTGKYVSKGNLYETWDKELSKDVKNINELAGSLEKSAKHLVLISKSLRPQDSQMSDLTYGILDVGFIQPIEVLLAGSHLHVNSYAMLQRIVEDRSMLNSWSKEKNNDFEPIIHPWAQNVSQLDPHATKEEILEASSQAFENFEDLTKRAFLGLSNFRYSTTSHHNRIRYVLARAHQSFMRENNLVVHGIQDLMKTTPASVLAMSIGSETGSENEFGYDLDHVFPQAENKAEFWKSDSKKDEEFGLASRYESVTQSLGNLILLHPGDNRMQRDELPWSEIKLKCLAASQLILNKALVPDSYLLDLESGTSVAKAISSARNSGCPTISDDEWGESQSDKLAVYYWKLIVADIRRNFGFTLS